ncbi:MAG: hypothetical protein KAI66_17755 [Lentisphaeria bacterium]|nr:hypothetical protein [Lentisphaeria bacterium]
MSVAVLLLFTLPLPVEARRGGGGGGRSSRSSFSTRSRASSSRRVSRPSRPRPTRSSSRSSTKKDSWSGSKPKSAAATRSSAASKTATTAKRTPSKTDRALGGRAAGAGKTYQSRDAATKAFRQKHAKEYTSRFDQKPAQRPSHVPSTYRTSSGTNVSVIYNSSHRGYGYYSGSRWRYYDPLMDAVILSSLMSSRGYYYDRYPHRRSDYATTTQYDQNRASGQRSSTTTFADYLPPQRRRRRIGFGAIVFVGLLVLGGIFLFNSIVYASRREYY